MTLFYDARPAGRLTALAILLSSTILTAIAPAQAQQSQAQRRPRRSPVTFVMPSLSYDRGAPGKRSEGASRTSFCGMPEGPVALTPQYSEPSSQPGGLAKERHYVLTKTSQAQPTFALHVPLAAQDVAALELTLVVEDLAGNLLYELPIPDPSEAGILTFQPALSQAPLVVGQRYNWAVMIEVACDEQDQAMPEYAWVGGQIERQAPEPASLVGLSGEERAQAYAEQGFWHEAMALVADLHRQKPDDEQYLADWSALLDSIGLADLAAAPLADCTQLLTAEL